MPGSRHWPFSATCGTPTPTRSAPSRSARTARLPRRGSPGAWRGRAGGDAFKALKGLGAADGISVDKTPVFRQRGSLAGFALPGYQLPLPAEAIGRKPGIERYFGREVILGIRPSDFEDASLADAGWARMPVTANATEELGSEILVMFLLDTPPVENRDTAALSADQDEDEAGISLAEGKTLWTARASARSRISAGSQVERSVDTGNLHFFDPGTGLTIGSKGNVNPAS